MEMDIANLALALSSHSYKSLTIELYEYNE